MSHEPNDQHDHASDHEKPDDGKPRSAYQAAVAFIKRQRTNGTPDSRTARGIDFAVGPL